MTAPIWILGVLIAVNLYFSLHFFEKGKFKDAYFNVLGIISCTIALIYYLIKIY